jgi:branched-chain amino acid transport system substrate-binding protein
LIRIKATTALLACCLLLAAGCGTRVDDSTSAQGVRAGTDEGTVVGDDGSGVVDGSGEAANDAGSGGSATGGATASGSGQRGASGGATGGGSSGGGSSGGAPIVIGAVGTRGGLIGDNGAGSWAALEAWVALINSKGGINGRRVQLIVADDGADPGRHAAAVRRLVQENKVTAFVGNFAPLTFSAGIPTLEESGVPSIGGDSGELGYFETPMAFAFNGAALPEGRTAGTWAPKAINKNALAIYYIGEIEFGNRVADELRKGWEKAGKQVVAYATISLGQPDYTAEIVRARSSNAEVVAVYADFSACRRFFDAARRQNYKPVWVVASACYHAGAADHADQTENNLYSSMPMEPPASTIPVVLELQDAMRRFAPNFPHPEANGVLMRGWASGKLFERVVAETGGKTDSKSLIDALHRMKNETIFGITAPLDWPPGPHPERPCGKMLKFDGKRWAIVTPDFIC